MLASRNGSGTAPRGPGPSQLEQKYRSRPRTQLLRAVLPISKQRGFSARVEGARRLPRGSSRCYAADESGDWYPMGSGLDMAILRSRIKEVQDLESEECKRNWVEGRCTHHIVAVLDVWIRRLALCGESVACGTHAGDCYVIDGLCGRGTSCNLYPDEQTNTPLVTAGRIRRYLGLQAEVTALYFDGDTLLAGCQDGSMRLWSAQAGPAEEAGAPGQCLHVLAGTAGDSVAFKGHCKRISHCQLVGTSRVISSSMDGSICIWDARSGELLHQMPVGKAVTSMFCTEDYVFGGLGDGTVAVWANPNTPMKQPRIILTFPAHPSPVTSIQYGRDKELEQDVLVTGCKDGVLRSWDFDQGGAPMQEFVGHGAEVVSLQFDDVKLLSAAKDGSIRCWDLRSGASLFGIWGHTAYIGSVAFDASRLVSDGTNNAIGLHDFGPGAPVQDKDRME